VVFGATVSGRPPELAGVDSTVGLFINTLPVRAHCAPWKTLAQVVADLQSSQAALLEHHYCGLLEIHKATGFGVLFDTIVVFQSYPFDSAAIAQASAAAGLAVTGFRAIGGSHYPLAVFAEQDPHLRLRLRLQYRHSAFDAGAAQRVAARFGHVLRAFLADPAGMVGAVGIRAPGAPGEPGEPGVARPSQTASDRFLRLLTPFLAPSAPGAVGELYVADELGGGHPGCPGLTAERFVADPLGPPGARMYRTGARVRWAADGRMEHVDSRDPRGRMHHRHLPEQSAGPAAEPTAEPAAERARAVRSEREELLCRLYADVLGRAEVGVDDDFFALGGNSLLATGLIGRIRSELRQQISIRYIFQYPTIAELDARWDDIATAVGGPQLRRMSRDKVSKEQPADAP
jgi:hypothetical protein